MGVLACWLTWLACWLAYPACSLGGACLACCSTLACLPASSLFWVGLFVTAASDSWSCRCTTSALNTSSSLTATALPPGRPPACPARPALPSCRPVVLSTLRALPDGRTAYSIRSTVIFLVKPNGFIKAMIDKGGCGSQG